MNYITDILVSMGKTSIITDANITLLYCTMNTAPLLTASGIEKVICFDMPEKYEQLNRNT